MGLTDRLDLLITANGAQARREFEQTGAAARRSLGQAETSAQQWSRTLTSAGVAMATFGGVALVGLYKAAQAADEENRAVLQLQNSIENSPALVGASTDAFLDQAAALQDTTRFADDATIAAQAMLATFRLTEDQVLGLTPAVQDLAAKFDVDLTTAAAAVGKAMTGNTTALRRWGVFVEDGVTQGERFDNVLAALRENAGGFAAGEAQTMAGQMDILKNNLGDVAEGIGQGVIPAMNSMLGPLFSATDAFTGMSASNQKAIGSLLTFGAAGLVAAGGTSVVIGQLLTMQERFRAFTQTTTGTRLGLLALNPAFQAVAGALAVGALAAYANSLNDVRLEIDGITNAAPGMVTRVAEAFQDLPFTSQEDRLNAFREAAEQNIVAAEQFGAAWARAGGPVGDIDQILAETAAANVGLAAETEGSAAASERLAEGLGVSATAAEDAESAIADLTERISDYLNETLGVGDAQDQLQSSFNSLFEQLLTGSRAFRGNSQAAIDNRAALDEIVRGTAEVIDVQHQQGAGERALQRTKQQSIARIREAQRNHLIEASAAREAIRAIRGIPARSAFHLEMTADNSQALSSIQAVYAEAQRAGQAVSQIGGSLAGGGTYSPPAPRSGGGESGGRTGGRRRPRPQEVIVIGATG